MRARKPVTLWTKNPGHDDEHETMNQSEEVTNTIYPIIINYNKISIMNSFLILLIVTLLCLVSVQSFSVSKINRFQLAKHVIIISTIKSMR